jgi:hypothetical protein
METRTIPGYLTDIKLEPILAETGRHLGEEPWN